MKKFSDLKIREKLGLLVIIFSIAILAVGSIGYFSLKRSNESTDQMYDECLMEVDLAYQNRLYMRRIRSDLFELILVTDQPNIDRLVKDIDDIRTAFNETTKQLETINLSPDQKNNVEELKKLSAVYREKNNIAIDLAKVNKNAEAFAFFQKEVSKVADDTTQKLRDITADAEKNAKEIKQKSDEEFLKMQILLAVIIVASIVLSITLAWLIIRQVISRVNDTVKFLDVVAAGDFSGAVPEKNLADGSEFGTLAKAIDQMNRNVRLLIKQLINTSEDVAEASQILTANADQTSQATNQVAQSIAEVAVGANKQLEIAITTNKIVGEMAKGICQVADNTTSVTSASDEASKAADKGNKIIAEAIEQMKTIGGKTEDTASVIKNLEEKSKQIDKIVKLISSIAEQTNLLALNAAIEAARAGTAGRGFAVVADEVRKLAEQSAVATKDVVSIIDEVQTKTQAAVVFMNENKNEVENGRQLVDTAGKNFEEILKQIQSISGELQDISAAVEELTAGTDEVIKSARDVEAESKKTAEETETISAAAEEQSASLAEISEASMNLSRLASDLEEAIKKFKI